MVRALLGAMVEISMAQTAVSLWNTLNPLTTYKIGINEQVLPEIKKWRIELNWNNIRNYWLTQ